MIIYRPISWQQCLPMLLPKLTHKAICHLGPFAKGSPKWHSTAHFLGTISTPFGDGNTAQPPRTTLNHPVLPRTISVETGLEWLHQLKVYIHNTVLANFTQSHLGGLPHKDFAAAGSSNENLEITEWTCRFSWSAQSYTCNGKRVSSQSTRSWLPLLLHHWSKHGVGRENSFCP